MKQLEQKQGIVEDIITGNRRTAIKTTSREWRTAELLGRLQNVTYRGKGVEANQSTYGRIN
jgi:hypothetical protein